MDCAKPLRLAEKHPYLCDQPIGLSHTVRIISYAIKIDSAEYIDDIRGEGSYQYGQSSKPAQFVGEQDFIMMEFDS